MAARKLAEDLDDLHSVNAHRKTLGEVWSGTMPLKIVLAGYKASQGNGVETRWRLFTSLIWGAKKESEQMKRAGWGNVPSLPIGLVATNSH